MQKKNKLLKITTSLKIITLTLTSAVAVMSMSLPCAADTISEACALNPNSAACQGMSDSTKLPTMAKNIINTGLMIVGMLAVAMIIYAGIRFITASGNAQQVATAKKILIYSVVGLVVALCSYAIVNFVIGKL